MKFKSLVLYNLYFVSSACSAPLLANSPLKAELQLKTQTPLRPPKKSVPAGLFGCHLDRMSCYIAIGLHCVNNARIILSKLLSFPLCDVSVTAPVFSVTHEPCNSHRHTLYICHVGSLSLTDLPLLLWLISCEVHSCETTLKSLTLWRPLLSLWVYL